MRFTNKLKDSIKYLDRNDILDLIIFIAILPVGIAYRAYIRRSRRHLWLFHEGKSDARDNGYVLFKYVRENYPDINAYYTIDKTSLAYKKVEKYGNIIDFRSFRHWIYYIAATKNISIHKSSSPNLAIFYVLHRLRLLNGHRIFLQHGVIKDDIKYLYYQETNFEMFLCGALPEYKYVNKTYGYPEGVVQYLGLPRFDLLHNVNVNKKKIVIMPTWRNWLGRETNALAATKDFTESQYFIKYQSLLNNNDFIAYIEENSIDVYFYPHANMERFIDRFTTASDRIHIVSSKNSDVQELISTSGLMITDYSSVAMDFAYMGKPLIYYQFDKKRFRSDHLLTGYFSYTRDGFGPVCTSEQELVKNMQEYCDDGLVSERVYQDRYNDFFALKDTSNCRRVMNRIIEIEKEQKVDIEPFTRKTSMKPQYSEGD